jgi:ATP-dependent helicase/nuclease subunit B
MAVVTRWVAVGEPAFQALADVVRRARSGDPLRPVTVVTPTPAAAVALRRELVRASGGTVGVGFQSLDALAEQLAAPRLAAGGTTPGRPLIADREALVAAVRVELARDPGRFAPIAHHRSTWETLARAITDLAGLHPARRAAISSGGSLPAAVVRLHDAVVEAVGVPGRVAVLSAACRRIREDPACLAPLGPVVLYLPGRLDHRSNELLRLVGELSDLVAVAGLAGIDDVDAPAVEAVVGIGGSEPDVPSPSPPVPTSVVTANDVDDEVRAAVRALLAHAEAGRPLRTMALVHPAGAPYTRAVAEVLRATGTPFSGPSTESLAHTAAGRVVSGLLDVAAHGFARQTLVDLWASGVVVGTERGPLPAARLDERTRRLGILAGRAEWHERLADRRRWMEEHPPEPAATAEVAERRAESRRREIEDLDGIEAALGTVEDLLDRFPGEWRDLGAWAGEVIDTLCGPVSRRPGWPGHEIEADTAVRTVVGRLAVLAGVDPHPSPEVLVDTLRSALDTPAPRRDRTGTGLLVTTVEQPPLVPLSAVAVVGLVEGHLPRTGRDDVLLGEHLRDEARLPLAAAGTADQHRCLLSALACASEGRILASSRGDQRSGRTQVPSRWLLDAIEDMTGSRPRTEDLASGRPTQGVTVIESHSASLRDADGGVVLDEHEHRLAALASAPDFDAHPAALDPVVSGGALLARSRAADAFTRFDGNLEGGGVDVLAEDEPHLSPTSIETYATCPRKWFFGHALGVREVDRPEEIDRLQARDKGSLAHRVLECFVAEAIEAGTVPAPGESWGPEGDERIRAVATRVFADFERRGLTGHPRWWAHDRREIEDVLVRTLSRDDDVRADARAIPVAVELDFGRDGAEPLRVTLDDGRVVALAGQADRVDEVPGGVMVHDYKYGSSTPYRGLDRPLDDGGDPVDGGRRLQLLAYAEAAAQQRGVDRASAWYWFLKPGHTGTRIGYEIGPRHRDLFRKTLGVLVDGIAAGSYPSRSGESDWWSGTNVNCAFCAFDDICPADREEEWERVRTDPALAELALLAQEGSPAFLVTAPTYEGPADADIPGYPR